MMPDSELQYPTFEYQLMQILKRNQIDMPIDIARTIEPPLGQSPAPRKRKKAAGTRKRKKDDGESKQE